MLEAVEVGKRYPGGVTALADVNLEVAAGETVVLVGESGSGKTTLLRMFNRLVEPSSGRILIDGKPAAEHDPIALRRRTGYVQQEGGLLPHWDVGRNVELVPTLLGHVRAARRDRANDLLRLVDLEPARYRGRYPHELSGGQRQRVAFARALAADPAVILLDEPFGALDALTRVELQHQFLELKARLKKTLVLVTHDLNEALRLADRIAVLKDGQLRQVAPPDVLRAAPADDYVRALLSLSAGGAA